MARIGRVNSNGNEFSAAFRDDRCYRLSSLLRRDVNDVERHIYSIAMNESGLIEDAIHDNIVDPVTDYVYRIPVPGVKSLRDFYAFEDHVRAGRSRRNLDMIAEWYEIPVFYYSGTSSLFAHGEGVPYPYYSTKLDFELELGFVIGREGIDISRENALDYVMGITIVNDWSARDVQMEEMKLNLGPAKGKDFATSIGPVILTADSLMKRRGTEGKFDIHVEASVNGKKYSDSNLDRIYHNIDSMIERASMGTKLHPGDIFMTGTVGTGCILELGEEQYGWLKKGDTVKLVADGIGTLMNEVV